MSNAVMVLDVLNATLSVAAKIQEILQRAQIEGRDVTDEELNELKMHNDRLEQDILNS